MTILTVQQLKRMCIGQPSAKQDQNMAQFTAAINQFGPYFGMDKLYNLASLLGQVMVESGEFRYDQEIWGPTPAQERYDTRTDLGNTPAKDGDGKKHKGYGPIQLTGAYNQGQFYEWALTHHKELGAPVPPNFKVYPHKILTDPWEGLSALWYWHVGNPEKRSLNRYAEQNNQLMVTKRVNGGTTAYDRRLEYQGRAALVLLGYGTSKDEIKRFQKEHQPTAGAVDGIIGDRTRDALHLAMKGKVRPAQIEKVETPVPVKVESLDKPWYKDLEGALQAGGGAVMTTVVGFLTNADTIKIVVVAGIAAAAFAAWYLIRRSKAKAQNAEVARINAMASVARTQ